MNEDFVGAGWAFPLGVNQRGGIALVRREQELEQAMRLILSTYPGERPMRPDFGCAIHDLIFAPNNANTHGLLIYHVKEALTKWEPRIQALGVDVELDDREPTRLYTKVEYQVIATNNVYNLVYPFYLQKSP